MRAAAKPARPHPGRAMLQSPRPWRSAAKQRAEARCSARRARETRAASASAIAKGAARTPCATGPRAARPSATGQLAPRRASEASAVANTAATAAVVRSTSRERVPCPCGGAASAIPASLAASSTRPTRVANPSAGHAPFVIHSQRMSSPAICNTPYPMYAVPSAASPPRRPRKAVRAVPVSARHEVARTQSAPSDTQVASQAVPSVPMSMRKVCPFPTLTQVPSSGCRNPPCSHWPLAGRVSVSVTCSRGSGQRISPGLTVRLSEERTLHLEVS